MREFLEDYFHWCALACVVLAGGLAFANAPAQGLLFDSVPVIRDDPRLQAFEWPRVRDILLDDYWFGLDSNLYRPLTTLSYALQYSVQGLADSPSGYILLNVLLHLGNGLLVVALARALSLSDGVALLAGLLFAVHPLATEAVTNVVGRADLLAALGVLAGLLLHVRAGPGARVTPARALGLAACALLAFGAKESGVVLLGCLVLYDLLLVRPGFEGTGGEFLRRRLRVSYAWCLAPVLLLFALRMVAFSGGATGPSPADNPLLLVGPASWLPTAAGILLRYVGLLLWPHPLSADYSYAALPLFDAGRMGAFEWFCVAAILILVAALSAAILLRARAPRVAFLTLLFFVTMAPVSNIFLRIGTIMAERLMYLPSVGLILLFAWGAGALVGRFGRAPLLPVVGLLLAVPLGWRTHLRNSDWSWPWTLFRSAVEVCPRSFKAHKSLAAALYDGGPSPDPLEERIDEVIDHAEIAWDILQELPPEVGYSDLLADLAIYYRDKARLFPAQAEAWLVRAEHSYRQALEAEAGLGRPGNWRVHRGLAQLAQQRGDTDAALEAYAAALPLAPGPEILEPFALLLQEAGQVRPARLCALRLITLQPAHGRMWELVSRSYQQEFPGEDTVRQTTAGWRFVSSHPAVAADLRAATRLQYQAQNELDPAAGASYRLRVQGTLGFDPLGNAAR